MEHALMIKKSIKIDASPARVWEVITDPAALKEAFFGSEVTADWRKGGAIVYKGVWEGKAYEDKGTILEIEPGKFLRYDYFSNLSGKEDKPENYQTIDYILTQEGDQTVFTVVQENMKDEKAVEDSEKGWEYILGIIKSSAEKKA